MENPHINHHSVLFFDGTCGLCNGLVDWTLKHKSNRPILFSAIQSNTGSKTLKPSVPADELEALKTVYYVRNNKETPTLFKKSTAILSLLADIGGMWGILSTLLFIIPRPIRDFGYDIVAANRYKIFGKSEHCRLPTPEERVRFLP
jgi:predicted DCC family thiol-disulfide oxidoreductase YuxK